MYINPKTAAAWEAVVKMRPLENITERQGLNRENGRYGILTTGDMQKKTIIGTEIMV
jgi:hypothetical protein